jgi:hypothetical protein
MLAQELNWILLLDYKFVLSQEDIGHKMIISALYDWIKIAWA